MLLKSMSIDGEMVLSSEGWPEAKAGLDMVVLIMDGGACWQGGCA
jgi:hypothetical protein